MPGAGRLAAAAAVAGRSGRCAISAAAGRAISAAVGRALSAASADRRPRPRGTARQAEPARGRPARRRLQSGAQSDRARRAAPARHQHGRDRTAAAGRRCTRGPRQPGAPLDLSTLVRRREPAPAAICRLRRRPIRTRPAPCRRRCRRPTRRRTNTTSPTAMCCTRIMRWRPTPSGSSCKQFPSDRLAPEAQYWLGESLFQQPAISRRRGSLPRRLDQIRHDARARPRRCCGSASRSPRWARRKRPAPRSARCCANIRALRLNVKQAWSGNRSVSTAEQAVRDDEASALFRGLEDLRGPLACGFRRSGLRRRSLFSPRVGRSSSSARRSCIAVTVDHGLRPEAAREAAAVKRLARRLGVPHRTLRWRGKKPQAGLQEAARNARYRLARAGRARAGIAHIPTAHTLDDQAETVLFRLARGSGLTRARRHGPCCAAAVRRCRRGSSRRSSWCARCSTFPRRGSIATLKAADRLQRRSQQSGSALYPGTVAHIDAGTGARRARCAGPGASRGAAAARRSHHRHSPSMPRGRRWRRRRGADTGRSFSIRHASRDCPLKSACGCLARAITHTGNEGPVELAKLEALYEGLRQAASRLRRTLAGALITLSGRPSYGRARPSSPRISHAQEPQEPLYEIGL